MSFTTKALSAATWPDLEAIFNARGCSLARNCWCMYYRKSGRSELPTRQLAQSNRAGLKALADGGRQVGLIGYVDGVPAGWISFGPREDFAKLANSRVMAAVDAQPVWSIICFVVPSEFRKQGIAKKLLDAAVAFCKKRKVTLIEAYPVDKAGRTADSNLWFGTKSMFDAAGFEEVARRKPERPVVRLRVAS